MQWDCRIGPPWVGLQQLFSGFLNKMAIVGWMNAATGIRVMSTGAFIGRGVAGWTRKGENHLAGDAQVVHIFSAEFCFKHVDTGK